MESQARKLSKDELKDIALRLRHRGRTNALMDGIGQAYEKAYLGFKTIWEYDPPKGDGTEVMTRELQGFRKVNIDEMPAGVPVPHSQDAGDVRVADSVLMTAPKDVYDEHYASDALAAAEDANLPKHEYLESLKQRGSAKELQGSAYGGISESTSILSVDVAKLTEGDKED